jgi:hypothetical protein
MKPGDKVRVTFQTARGTMREWIFVAFFNQHTVDLRYPGCVPEQFDLRTGAGAKGPNRLWLIHSDDLTKLRAANPHARFAARRGVV